MRSDQRGESVPLNNENQSSLQDNNTSALLQPAQRQFTQLGSCYIQSGATESIKHI